MRWVVVATKRNAPLRCSDNVEEDRSILTSQAEPLTPGESIRNILERRLKRRTVLKGVGVVAAAPVLSLLPSLWTPEGVQAAPKGGLGFTPIAGSSADKVIVPEGYQARVLLSWGKALFSGVPDLDTGHLDILLTPQGAELQAKQFGYNCDFNSFFSLFQSHSSRGLLATHHEFTSEELMFPGWPGDDAPVRTDFLRQFPAVVSVMKAAHGVSIVEVIRRDGQWYFKQDSPFNRRITGETPMELTGPAAGHSLLQTAADPSGKKVLGTLNNCAGGKTPWGTLLTCEENFDQYFGHLDGLKKQAEKEGEKRPELKKYAVFHGRLPLPRGLSSRGWELVDKRFDVAEHPTEAFRFGWVVEIDPYHPDSTPKKRTALGRFKREGANVMVAPEGQVAVYSGDDTPFEYIYKFVSDKAYDPQNRAHNLTLLDKGTLYVARFQDDGTGQWLPLVFGQTPLDEDHGFTSQAEVLINTRRAADLVGATPMDRPEDIEANPVNGKIYVPLTNNSWRGAEVNTFNGRRIAGTADAKNPRTPNKWGHIIEMTEHSHDPTALTFSWEIFILCGNPSHPEGKFLTSLTGAEIGPQDTYFGGYPAASQVSPLGSPDNLAFDRLGNLWIATDGRPDALNLSKPINNGLYGVPTAGKNRGWVRQFLSGPQGCEVCGPEFTPDNRTLFVSIQHPGEGGTLRKGVSDWPEGKGRPPRPSVIAITRNDGGRIGS
ncbi:PhoX family phosphatase [Nitrosococcus wardiae]|uniref:PhoX family phosphatase n=1 Tax=Nitrosococcus wardiae TaxID=1814290 RepID=A0A4P7BZJ0_9GAMM|nr:PhoX family phosphatase [Nitrosococcus wardiae]